MSAPALAAHAARRVGGRWLLADETGSALWVSDAERAALESGRAGPELLARAADAGLLRERLDLGGLAGELAARGWPGWRGPARVVLVTEGMTPATARAAVDLAFEAPGRGVRLELRGTGWPAVWLSVQYARRRAEWSHKALALSWTAPAGLPGPRAAFARDHGVRRRAPLLADGPPPRAALPEAVPEVELRVGEGAREPAAWADWLASCGVERARLVEPFALGFYQGFLERLLDRPDLRLREETAAALLRRAPWALPGMDVSGELAVAPDGGVWTSLFALEAGRAELRLGGLPGLRYGGLAEHPAVRACLSAAQADHQPLCSRCAHRGLCAVPPSVHLVTQGAPWGELPTSAACRDRLALLDWLQTALDSEKGRELQAKWAVDNL